MKQRSYKHYCPIAHALDLVGDRWTLLIVRDLLLGPKRFSDLSGGLPGLGTNILTDRLKSLEQAGIIQQRVLPPPAASTVYELTAYGQTLEGPLNALAQWGGQTLGQSQPDQVISRDSVMLTVRALFRALALPAGPTIYAVDVGDARLRERITVRVTDGRVEVAHGDSTPPNIVLHMDVDTLFALAGGFVSLADSIACGRVQAHGSPDVLAHLVQAAAPRT
jgi:DNA-binding HxlR family transcriptional regulator